MCSNHTWMNTHIWSSCWFYLIKAIIKIQWQEHNGNPISWQSLADCSWPDSHYLESQYTHSSICMQTYLWPVSLWFETQLKCRNCPVSAQWIGFIFQALANVRRGRRDAFRVIRVLRPCIFSSRAPRQCESIGSRFSVSPPLRGCRFYICRQTEFQRPDSGSHMDCM